MRITNRFFRSGTGRRYESKASPPLLPPVLPLLFLSCFFFSDDGKGGGWLVSAAELDPPSTAEQATFSDALTSVLYSGVGKNECTSSWGVSMLFDLVYSSGTSQTVGEMCAVLGLCGPYIADDDDGDDTIGLHWEAVVADLTSSYDGACSHETYPPDFECEDYRPTVKVANSVWVDDDGDYALDPEFLSVAGEFLHQIDFQNASAGDRVNDWVNETTLGLIDSIMEAGPINHDLVAVNSIYLQATWSNRFEAYNTNQDAFYQDSTRSPLPAGEEQLQAHFMHQVDSFPYSATAVPGYQLVKLPYKSGSLSMVIALPLGPGLDPVTSADVIGALPSLLTRKVALALPKFRIVREYEGELLSGALESLGLPAPFDDGEGFCDMFDGVCAYLDYIVQKTYIEVDELGTKAAAVTAGFFTVTSIDMSIPVLFRADHPFQFFILNEFDDQDDMDVLALFEGKVVEPGVVPGSSAPLQAKHEDDDFWSSLFGEEPVEEDPYTGGATPITPTSVCDEKSDVGMSCEYDTDCCSARCDGPRGNRKCKTPVIPESECPGTRKKRELGRRCGRSVRCCSKRCERVRRNDEGKWIKKCAERTPRLPDE